MSLTIKELAEELDVSKTAIRKHMDDEFRDTYTEKNGNKILITDDGVKVLKDQFENSKATEEKTQTAPKSSAAKKSNSSASSNVPAPAEETKLLAEQLEEQAKQIKQKDKQIAELHQLLDQSQRLQLDVQNKLKQLENKQPQPKAIETKEDNIPSDYRPGRADNNSAYQADSEDKKHWWQFWN